MTQHYSSQNSVNKKETGQVSPNQKGYSRSGEGRNTTSGETSSEGYYGRHFEHRSDEHSVSEQEYRQYNSETWAGLTTGVTPLVGNQPVDEQIYKTLQSQIDEYGTLDTGRMQVRVENGVVFLSGKMDTPLARRTVQEVAEVIPGVRSIQNDLEAAPDIGAQAWPADDVRTPPL